MKKALDFITKSSAFLLSGYFAEMKAMEEILRCGQNGGQHKRCAGISVRRNQP